MNEAIENFLIWLDWFIHALFYGAVIFIIPVVVSIEQSWGIQDSLMTGYYTFAVTYASYMTIVHGKDESL